MQAFSHCIPVAIPMTFNFFLKGKSYFLLIDFTFWVILNPCNLPPSIEDIMFQIKSCVRYIFSSLFFKCKRELLRNQKNCFLFHFKSSFCSWENQSLEFEILRFLDVIKHLRVKQEIHFGNKNTLLIKFEKFMSYC